MTEYGFLLNLAKFEAICIHEDESGGKFDIVAVEKLHTWGDEPQSTEESFLTGLSEEQAEQAMRLLFNAIESPDENGWNAKDFKNAEYVPIAASVQRNIPN